MTLLIPEILLAMGILLLILWGAFQGGARVTRAAIGLLIAVLGCVVFLPGAGRVFDGAFVEDAFTHIMKALALGGTVVTLLMSGDYMRQHRYGGFEYPILVLLATLGAMVLISAGDFLALYLGIELMSLSLYVIAAYHREDLRATEAGLKYFVLGSLSSGMMLYGLSLMYGFAGTLSFAGVSTALTSAVPLGVVFGLVFILAGLAFKISAVPFHMWTPDVYEGVPTPVTAFFASTPKIAAMAVTLRLLFVAFASISGEWRQVIAFMAMGSMALGSFAAIGQTNIKRLLAYSSIGHIGFALVGVAAGTVEGVQAVIFYMMIYLVMTLGAFSGVLLMRRQGHYVETIGDLAGLSRSHPTMAFLIAALMFSLAGIPPLAGFFAKFYVFSAAMEAHLYGLAILGVLLSVVAAVYYLRIVKIMYFDEAVAGFDEPGGFSRYILLASALGVIFIIISPTSLVHVAQVAAEALF